MTRTRVYVVAIALLVLVTAALTTPVRAIISRSLSSILNGPKPTTAEPSLATQSAGDLGDRARNRHGWSSSIDNSVMQATATFYDEDGTTSGQAQLVIYRRYPNRLRAVITRGVAVEVIGFDGANTWSSTGAANPRRARDIRQWLRISPERLFTTRAAGASYSEVGGRREDFKPARPWQGQSRILPPLELEQVEIEDTLVAPASGAVGDRRRITYYLNRSNYTIEAARWLEPDEPWRGEDDPSPAFGDLRVDFGDWHTVGGVLWPYDIVHWQGGKVDYRIAVIQVLINQTLADTIFQSP